MNANELMQVVRGLLDDTKTAILATSGPDGVPRVRWMTPAVLDEWPNELFCLTSPESVKAGQIKPNREVEWMVQSATLDRVVHLRGRAVLVDNPAARAIVVERLSGRLAHFWRNHEPDDCVVLETVLTEATIQWTISGREETVRFDRNAGGESSAWFVGEGW